MERLAEAALRTISARSSSGTPAREFAASFDSVWIDLSKGLGCPVGAVLAGSKADIAAARDWRHVYGGALYQGWMPALLAHDGLRAFPRDIARAHGRAAELVRALVASGKVRDASNPNPSNIHRLAMAEDLARAAFERGRQAGVRIGRWEDGNLPLFVNTTLLRRPVEELAALFLG